MIYIGLENDNWYIENGLNVNRTYKKDEEMKTIFDGLSNLKIDKAYYINNLHDLVIEINNQKFVLKNYDNIKDNFNLVNLKNQIKKGLMNMAISKIKKNKVKLIKTGIIIAGVTVSIILIANALKEDEVVHIDVPVASTTVQEDINEKVSNNQNIISEDDEKTPIISDSINEEVNIDSKVTDTSYEKDTIKDYFDMYAKVFGIYSDKDSLYEQNKDNLKHSSNIERDVLLILYDYYENNLYGGIVTSNHYDETEQIDAILKYASIFEVKDTDTLCTMISIHKLESGHGLSQICAVNNNLGGIFFTNPFTGNWETKKYPNLDVAALDFVRTFLNIKERCEKLDSYDPNRTLEQNMNLMYCTLPDDPFTPDFSWSERVANLKQEVLESGILNNKHY